MNILLVEDGARVSRFISRGLASEGHACVVTADAIGAWSALESQRLDLIILDRKLPGADGISLCEHLRARGHAVEDRVSGLRAGADDYMTKPFDFEELLARVDALSRRWSHVDGSMPRSLGPLCVDARSRRAWVSSTELRLTALEFDLLCLFVENAEVVLSRERILSRVWGQAEDPLTNIVDVYVGRLRRKLEPTAARGGLQTVRGVGYRLSVVAAVSDSPEPSDAT